MSHATRSIGTLKAHHTAFIAGSVIVSAGAFLVIAAMAGAMRLAPGRGGALVTTGAVLACISAAGLGAGTLMLGTVMGMLTPAHAGLAVRVDQIASHSSIGSLPFIPAPGLMVGALLVAVGLYRARLAPRWTAILLGVSVVPVAVAPSGGALGAVLHLPLSVALGALGIAVWRSGRPDHAGMPVAHRQVSPAQT